MNGRDQQPSIGHRPMPVFTLAHLSDPHLGALAWPGLPALLNKRILGYLSWTFRRRPVHEGTVLPALVEDLRRVRPDHIVVTGDITNISLPDEFTRGAAWLRGLADAHDLTVIPGNHDAYVGVPWERSLGHWSGFMSGAATAPFTTEAPARSPEDFPFVRLRGPVALIGVSTAAPMPALSAAGRIGAAQLGRLATQLDELGRRKLFRVVLIHHPPLPGAAKPRKQLEDAADFRAVIARCGAELVLFGHTHLSALGRLATPAGTVPAIGVPSASARPHRGKDHSRYHLYRIEADGDGWRLDVEVRGVGPALDRFDDEARFDLAVPA
jgi:3',5'-cyclic AMP phosphodiesterase CpdA